MNPVHEHGKEITKEHINKIRLLPPNHNGNQTNSVASSNCSFPPNCLYLSLQHPTTTPASTPKHHHTTCTARSNTRNHKQTQKSTPTCCVCLVDFNVVFLAPLLDDAHNVLHLRVRRVANQAKHILEILTACLAYWWWQWQWFSARKIVVSGSWQYSTSTHIKQC